MKKDIKILYIDDEVLNRKIFEFNFRSYFQVCFANDGIEGLEKLKEFDDITHVISDYRMPKMNGLNFILEAKKRYPNKLFYLLSGFDITPETKSAIENKIISKYFQKPYNREEIKTTILQESI